MVTRGYIMDTSVNIIVHDLYWLLGLNLFLAYQIAEDYLLSLGFML